MKILHFNCDHCHQVLEINSEDFKEEFRNEESICGEMVECPQCKNQTRCVVKNFDINAIEIKAELNQESPPFIETPPVFVEKKHKNLDSYPVFNKFFAFTIFCLIILALCLNVLKDSKKENQNVSQTSSPTESIDSKCSGACSKIEVKRRDSGYLIIEGEIESISTTRLKDITVHASFFEGKAKAYTGSDSIAYLNPGETWKFRVVGLRDGLDGTRIDGFTADIPIVGVSRLYVKYSNYIKTYDQ